MISRRRVLETYDAGADVRGSGFLLSGGLVLTAAHCVPSGHGAAVEIRREADASFRRTGTVKWVGAGDCDLALISVADSDVTATPVPLGRPVAPVQWEAVGFPWAQERPGPEGARTASEAASGRLDPLTGLRAGTYDVQVSSGTPTGRGPGRSPWGGMSGAAVFAENTLVGVLVEDPARFGPDRLRAVPITRLLQDPEAAALLGPEPSASVEAVWPGYQAVLSRPYEALPAASPLLLLQYHYAVLPFHPARHADLDWLQGWCTDEDQALAVAAVDGVGGAGKTRLGAQLCQLMRESGWVGGLLSPYADAQGIKALARLAEPRLIVVDTADTRADQVLTLAQALASEAQQAPIRVLLLARECRAAGTDVSGWWRGLLSPGNPLQAAFVMAAHRTLVPLPATPEGIADRRTFFGTARQRFAGLLGVPDTAAEPDLASSTYDTFLFLQVGALVALISPDQLPGGESELLDSVLSTERELIWRPTARAAGLAGTGPGPTDSELDVALAVATLAVADSRVTAVQLLEQVPDMVAAGPVTRAADWLRHLYPGSGWFRPVRPDLLGEHHVGRVVAVHPELPRLLLERAVTGIGPGSDGPPALEAARLGGRVLTVMARAAEHQADELRPILEAALTAADAGGEPLLSRFVIQGIQRQADPAAVSPLAAGLVAALAVTHVPPAADAAYQHIWALESVPSYLLDDLRVALAEQYLEHVRSLAHADPKRRPDLVDALIKTRGAMMQGGREIESRALVTDAIAVARELHNENPDQYAKTLAFTLEGGSSSLMAAQPDDALDFAQEAVALTEPLAGSDRNKLEALARAYQNLAFRLSSAGRHDEAVRAGEHAVAIMRETGPSGPSDVYSHRWKLSNAQTTLAHQLVAAGRVEDAVRCARQVVHDAEALEPADQMRPYRLAHAYNLLGRILRDGHRASEGVDPAQRAVTLFRSLSSQDPQHTEMYLGSLNELALVLQAAGRPAEAVRPAREVVDLYREMAEASPHSKRIMLAGMLGNLSNALSAAGQLDAATDAAHEELSIFEDLATRGINDPERLKNARQRLDQLRHMRGAPTSEASPGPQQ